MTLPLLLVMLAVPPEKPSLGVIEFAPQGASAEFAAAMTTLAAHELERLGVFRVVTADMVRTLLGAERQKQLLGGESEVVTSDLVSFDFLVTGKVQKISKSDFTLVLSLIETKTSKQRSSQTAKAGSDVELTAEVGPALVKLLGRVLEERSGSVVVVSSEAGATVKLDDATVGVTPLPGRVAAGAGPHLIQVEKDGFVSWRREVRVQPDEATEQVANLVPSPDTIAAYETRASRMRLGAWLTSGLAAASVVTFFVSQSLADRAYEEFRARRERLVLAGEGEGGANRLGAQAAAQQVQLMQTLSYVSAGVFAASAAVSAYLWIAGDSPGKYGRYRELGVQPAAGPKVLSVRLAPALGGAVLQGEF